MFVKEANELKRENDLLGSQIALYDINSTKQTVSISCINWTDCSIQTHRMVKTRRALLVEKLYMVQQNQLVLN